jgi:hypothetical protein
MKIPSSLFLPALFIVCILNVPALADDDLATRDWSAVAARSLKDDPPAPGDVGKLISKALDSDWEVNPCSYAFVDPAQDGTYRLIAAFDGSSYHTCNRVVVIAKKGGKLTVANDWQTRMAEKVENITLDLDGNGSTEIVIPEAWTKYEEGHCIAMWQKAYKWEDGRFTDHSADYPGLYKARLKELNEAIPRLRDPTCSEMERDKISRFLNIDPTAGYALALSWMKSPEPFMRRKAASVFADINDGESRKNLSRLKSDSDPLVAETAKLYLDPTPGP